MPISQWVFVIASSIFVIFLFLILLGIGFKILQVIWYTFLILLIPFIYLARNMLILDLFAVSSASSYCIYKLFKVSTTLGLIKAVIAGVVIGLISLLLTKVKYIGKALAEAYGVFWGILLFLGVQHFWIWKKWTGVLIGIVAGIGVAVLHHFMFKDNIEDISYELQPVNELIDKIKGIVPTKKIKKDNYVNEISVANEPVVENKPTFNIDLKECLAKARAELENPESLTIKKINEKLHNIRNVNDVKKLTELICIQVSDERIENLINALIGYVFYEYSIDELNFSSLMLLLNSMEVKEDYVDAVDLLFKDLEEENPQHFAVKQYNQYKSLPMENKINIVEKCRVEFSKIK